MKKYIQPISQILSMQTQGMLAISNHDKKGDDEDYIRRRRRTASGGFSRRLWSD